MSSCPCVQALQYPEIFDNRQIASDVQQLYERFSAVLYSNILNFVPEPEAAGKILCSVILKSAVQSQTSFNKTSTELLTLLNLGRNEAINYLVDPAPYISAEKVYLRNLNEKHFAVACKIKQLPLFEKTIIALLYFRNLTIDEISGLLGIPASFIKEKIKRSLVQLEINEADREELVCIE